MKYNSIKVKNEIGEHVFTDVTIPYIDASVETEITMDRTFSNMASLIDAGIPFNSKEDSLITWIKWEQIINCVL